jgi:hypothetical protein
LGLQTGTNDSSISFSMTSSTSAEASAARLRIATSTPSVVKLALAIEEETRVSISACALEKRCSLGASHFAVKPGGVLMTRTRSLAAALNSATASRMWMKPVCRPG